MNINFKVIWGSVLSCAFFFGQSQAATTNISASLLSTTSSEPTDNINPYEFIVDRNVFRLNSHFCGCAEPVIADLPNVKITGFSGSDGITTAFFAIVPKGPNERVTYFALSEKMNMDSILELVKIHSSQEEVDVLINGTPKTLSVKNDSFLAHVP